MLQRHVCQPRVLVEVEALDLDVITESSLNYLDGLQEELKLEILQVSIYKA